MTKIQLIHPPEWLNLQAKRSPLQAFLVSIIGMRFDERQYDRLAVCINDLFIFSFAAYSFSAWLIFSTQTILTGESLVIFSSFVRRMFYLAAGMKLINQRYSPLQGFLTVLLIVLFWKSCTVCADNLLFISLLFMLGSQDVPLRRIALASSIVILIICISNASLIPFGYTTDIINIRANGIVSHSFGWTHRNGFAMGIAFFWCSWLGFRQNKVSIVEIILLGLSIAFTYLLSGSRTGGIALFLLFLLQFYWKGASLIHLFFRKYPIWQGYFS